MIPVIFDRSLLKKRRERACAHIKNYDFLLKDTAENIFQRLQFIKKKFETVLDVGSVHGLLAEKLKNDCYVIRTDLSESFLPDVVADEEFLPFKRGILDAVFANLSLHLTNDLPGALSQINNVLKPDGLFMAALLGGESLKELRDVLMQAEIEVMSGASPRIFPFITLQDMAGLMQRSGFALPVVDSESVMVDYESIFKLMQDIRGMGAANVLFKRIKTMTPRRVFLRAAEIYQEKYGDSMGRIPATFEIIYVIGWKPDASQQQPLKRGSAKARLSDALNVAEISAGDKVTS